MIVELGPHGHKMIYDSKGYKTLDPSAIADIELSFQDFQRLMKLRGGCKCMFATIPCCPAHTQRMTNAEAVELGLLHRHMLAAARAVAA